MIVPPTIGPINGSRRCTAQGEPTGGLNVAFPSNLKRASPMSYTETDVPERSSDTEKSRSPTGRRGRRIAWAGGILFVVLAVIAALTHWPADWREPLRFGPSSASSDTATHSGSSIGHLSSSSSVKGVTRAIPPISSGDQLEVENRVGNLVHQDRN